MKKKDFRSIHNQHGLVTKNGCRTLINTIHCTSYCLMTDAVVVCSITAESAALPWDWGVNFTVLPR